MDREVFLSLLALDSYNRGYGTNIGDLNESGSIGSATIRPFEPDAQDGWESAGFYAIAYDWNGETVISYRGTDAPSDAIAFGIGAGQPFALTGGLTDQARLTNRALSWRLRAKDAGEWARGRRIA